MTQRVVHVNRLHILQRFHDYLAQAGDACPRPTTPCASLQAPAGAGLPGLRRVGRADGEGVQGVPRGPGADVRPGSKRSGWARESTRQEEAMTCNRASSTATWSASSAPSATTAPFPAWTPATSLVRAGSVGHVRNVGTFLQDQIIYAVHFFEVDRIVGLPRGGADPRRRRPGCRPGSCSATSVSRAFPWPSAAGRRRRRASEGEVLKVLAGRARRAEPTMSISMAACSRCRRPPSMPSTIPDRGPDPIG